MAAPSLPAWQRVLLSRVGAPDTPQNELFLTDWSRAEGGGATNNPFNTTQPGFGATGNYNSVGVKNYADPQAGINATVKTLTNGRYTPILSALRAGVSARDAAQALAASPWGTGALVLKMLGGKPVTNTQHGGVTTTQLARQRVAGAPQPPDNRTALLSMLQSTLSNYASTGQATMDPVIMTQMLANQRQASQPNQAPVVASQGVTAAPTAPQGHFKLGDPVANGTSIGGLHPTEGLTGYEARDYFAPSGSTTVAPITGKVIKLSGHDPSMGPIEGPHGPLGWSVYIQGTDGHIYYLTHMGSRNVKIGQTVKAGQPIGTVADYSKYGTPSHIHMGVH